MQPPILHWISLYQQSMLETFAGRMVFLGLQGSYRRGEAHAGSDVDLVAVLDQVDLATTRRYRNVLQTMPFGHLACGFLCGVEDLKRWPRFDRFHLLCDTQPIYGSLEEILPPPTREDAWHAVQIGSANLYHAVLHTLAFAATPQDSLPSLFKETFFVLRAAAFARNETMAYTKCALLPLLAGKDREVLLCAMRPPREANGQDEADRCFSLLLSWCQDMLAECTQALEDR